MSKKQDTPGACVTWDEGMFWVPMDSITESDMEFLENLNTIGEGDRPPSDPCWYTRTGLKAMQEICRNLSKLPEAVRLESIPGVHPTDALTVCCTINLPEEYFARGECDPEDDENLETPTDRKKVYDKIVEVLGKKKAEGHLRELGELEQDLEDKKRERDEKIKRMRKKQKKLEKKVSKRKA